MEWIRRAAIVALVLLFTAVATAGGGSVRVRGYTRKDGTYVAPHYRSTPNPESHGTLDGQAQLMGRTR